jgi:hypothetical protein
MGFRLSRRSPPAEAELARPCTAHLLFSPASFTCRFHLPFSPASFTCFFHLPFSPASFTCSFHLLLL